MPRAAVINSLSAGPELRLIIEKIIELISENNSGTEICNNLNEYRKKTELYFMLKSMKNLANNGRVSHLAAKAAGLLGIRVVGKASDVGDLQPLDKARGEQKAITSIIDCMHKESYWGGKVRIAHCQNEKVAESLKTLITKEFAKADVEIYSCRGLCSFYAEKGGVLIGFEKK